eukprot:TRINITY_DN9680_c0_g1_i1.p1 TRINITY_DN9680_c0_g1~~TRINITY_DN9680_c0_g1_i1.p1  ORF type:complete len:340 (+),score=54.60 TRINITY_DN9680_c0_g1_i1:145-1164(+)
MSFSRGMDHFDHQDALVQACDAVTDGINLEPGRCPSLPRKGLIIGQAPPGPPESLPEGYQPLQGRPERRLAQLAGLADPNELWSVFDRVDLIGWCPGPKDRKDYHLLSTGYRKHRCDGHRFPMSAARLAASRLTRFGGLAKEYAVVVLLGRIVASAFQLRHHHRGVPWTEEIDGVRYLVLPHPSGVSHFWNDEVSWHRAAGTFRAALKAVQFFRHRPLAALPSPEEPAMPIEDASTDKGDAGIASDAESKVTSKPQRCGRRKAPDSGSKAGQKTTRERRQPQQSKKKPRGKKTVVRSRFFAPPTGASRAGSKASSRRGYGLQRGKGSDRKSSLDDGSCE